MECYFSEKNSILNIAVFCLILKKISHPSISMVTCNLIHEIIHKLLASMRAKYWVQYLLKLRIKHDYCKAFPKVSLSVLNSRPVHNKGSVK